MSHQPKFLVNQRDEVLERRVVTELPGSYHDGEFLGGGRFAHRSRGQGTIKSRMRPSPAIPVAAIDPNAVS
jgi:hypothetical protein